MLQIYNSLSHWQCQMSNSEIDILSSLLLHLSYVITDGWQSCLCNNSAGFSFISVHATTDYIILLTLPLKNWRQKGTGSCELMWFGKWSGLNGLSGFYSGFSRMRSYYIQYTSSCGCGIETRGVRRDRRSVEKSGLSIESWSTVQGVGTEYTAVEFKRFRNALLATWYVSEVFTLFRCR